MRGLDCELFFGFPTNQVGFLRTGGKLHTLVAVKPFDSSYEKKIFKSGHNPKYNGHRNYWCRRDGYLNAKKYALAGYTVRVSDIPSKREDLEKQFDGTGIKVTDGTRLSKKSDIVLYGVPTESIDEAAARYGRHVKRHAIVKSNNFLSSQIY